VITGKIIAVSGIVQHVSETRRMFTGRVWTIIATLCHLKVAAFVRRTLEERLGIR
jgi:hypothetical protein